MGSGKPIASAPYGAYGTPYGWFNRMVAEHSRESKHNNRGLRTFGKRGRGPIRNRPETLRRRLANQTPFTVNELEAIAEVLEADSDTFLNSAYWPQAS